MNVSIELSPVIEKQVSEVAANYDINVQEFAAQFMQELIAGVGFASERQFDTEQMLIRLASRMQASREQARAAQIEKNQAAIALLRAWRLEDANVSEQEGAARVAEGKALEEGMTAHPFTLHEWTQ